MANFTIEIAGKAAAVSSLFESSRDYCRAYLTDRPADFSVTVTRADLEFEQSELLREAREEGFKPRIFTDPFLDRAAIQRKVAEHLFAYDVLLFHGSAIAVDGEGYLFTARSGTGKSTHTRLWRQVFGDRAVMINDDKPFLKFTQKEIFLCGAPWSGKHGLDTNAAVPLKGICILERGRENCIAPLLPREAEEMLKKQSVPPLESERLEHHWHLVDRLGKTVPLWRMTCTKDPQAAVTAWEAMAAPENGHITRKSF